jgi:hypothetical protein
MILEQEINVTSSANLATSYSTTSQSYSSLQRFFIGLACVGFFPAVYLIGKLLVG